MTGIIHSVMYTVLCILFVGRIHFKVIMNTPLAIKTSQFAVETGTFTGTQITGQVKLSMKVNE